MDKQSIFVLGHSVSIHYGPYLKEMINSDIQIKLDEYKKNLLQIISIFKEIANSVVWIGLTPVVET